MRVLPITPKPNVPTLANRNTAPRCATAAVWMLNNHSQGLLKACPHRHYWEVGKAARGGNQWEASKATSPGKELVGPPPVPLLPDQQTGTCSCRTSTRVLRAAGPPNHVLLQLSPNRPVPFIKSPHVFVSMTQR